MVTAYTGPSGVLLVVEAGLATGLYSVHLHAVGTWRGAGLHLGEAHVNHPETARPHGLLNNVWRADRDLQIHTRRRTVRPMPRSMCRGPG
jgi:hypothetical protein